MRIPKKVRIGPYDYDLAYKETLLSDNHDAVLWGHCDFERQTIYLTTNMVSQRRETAFMHEVIHAIDDLCEIGLEERQVRALAPALVSFLKENKMLKGGE